MRYGAPYGAHNSEIMLICNVDGAQFLVLNPARLLIRLGRELPGLGWYAKSPSMFHVPYYSFTVCRLPAKVFMFLYVRGRGEGREGRNTYWNSSLRMGCSQQYLGSKGIYLIKQNIATLAKLLVSVFLSFWMRVVCLVNQSVIPFSTNSVYYFRVKCLPEHGCVLIILWLGLNPSSLFIK